MLKLAIPLVIVGYLVTKKEMKIKKETKTEPETIVKPPKPEDTIIKPVIIHEIKVPESLHPIDHEMHPPVIHESPNEIPKPTERKEGSVIIRDHKITPGTVIKPKPVIINPPPRKPVYSISGVPIQPKTVIQDPAPNIKPSGYIGKIYQFEDFDRIGFRESLRQLGIK